MDAFVHCECHESEAPSYFYLPEIFYLLETRIDVDEVKAPSFVTLLSERRVQKLERFVKTVANIFPNYYGRMSFTVTFHIYYPPALE